MTDADFLCYCDLHCETPRALFSWQHVVRLHDLAGVEVEVTGPAPSFLAMHQDVAKPLIERARARIKTAGLSDRSPVW